jgi:hypothetical protein
MERGPPSGETGDRKVETASEKMDGTRLAQKTAAEELKHTIDLNQRPSEGMGCLGVVGRMGTFIGKPIGFGISFIVIATPMPLRRSIMPP